jgi:hypothetical protein
MDRDTFIITVYCLVDDEFNKLTLQRHLFDMSAGTR